MTKVLEPNTIVLATSNKGKIREIRAALSSLEFTLPTQEELGVPSPDEPYLTFMENALAKARHAAAQTNLPALADDSGIVVPALGGAPGVLSARYAEDSNGATDDDKNNEKLLHAMLNITDRRAFYYALLIFVRSAEDPAPVFAEGIWHGEIASVASGTDGFGYDPIFYDPRVGKTGAQMSIAEKQRVSHRGKSLRQLTRRMRWQRQTK